MRNSLLAVNVSYDYSSISGGMRNAQVLANPGDEVVLEGALDQLMEDVGGYKLVNICTRKICSKWL